MHISSYLANRFHHVPSLPSESIFMPEKPAETSKCPTVRHESNTWRHSSLACATNLSSGMGQPPPVEVGALLVYPTLFSGCMIGWGWFLFIPFYCKLFLLPSPVPRFSTTNMSEFESSHAWQIAFMRIRFFHDPSDHKNQTIRVCRMGVSKNRGKTPPKSSMFNRVFHYFHHPFLVQHPYVPLKHHKNKLDESIIILNRWWFKAYKSVWSRANLWINPLGPHGVFDKCRPKFEKSLLN